MTAAFIEHRPKSSDPQASTSHFVIVLAGGQEIGNFKTQKEAKDKPATTAIGPCTSRASGICKIGTSPRIGASIPAELENPPCRNPKHLPDFL